MNDIVGIRYVLPTRLQIVKGEILNFLVRLVVDIVTIRYVLPMRL